MIDHKEMWRLKIKIDEKIFYDQLDGLEESANK